MRDHTYDQVAFRAPQLEHRYGPNVHILADPLALTQLAKLCAKGTYQPEINTLVAVLYRDLLRIVVDVEDTPENHQFFVDYKVVLKERFQQVEIYIVSFPVHLI